jgi:uncharacterized protein YjiS (DUF1127 family)
MVLPKRQGSGSAAQAFPPSAVNPYLTEIQMEMHTHASLRAIHGFDGSIRVPTSLGALFSRLLQRLQEAARRRHDYDTLMAKDDRDLRDIGLTRADVVDAFSNRRPPARRHDRG